MEVVAPIAVAGLIKNFESKRAMDGLDLEVRTGEVHRFLGPTTLSRQRPISP